MAQGEWESTRQLIEEAAAILAEQSSHDYPAVVLPAGKHRGRLKTVAMTISPSAPL